MNRVTKGLVALLVTMSAAATAQAGTYNFTFSGSGVSGTAQLTTAVNPNTGVLPLTSPNPVDPIGSSIVTGISGTFSDATLGISNAAITGLVPTNPATPEPANLRSPHSFGRFIVANGVPLGGGEVAPGVSYDNLFYPGGSPQAASDYPFHGGIFDIYGILFTIDTGLVVNFWSNGSFGAGASYGTAVTDGTDVLDYVGNVAAPGVPEAATWAMLITGLGAIGTGLRRRRMLAA